MALVASGAPSPASTDTANPAAADNPRRITVLDLQPFSERSRATVVNASAPVRVTLVNLHPTANAWFVLVIERGAAVEIFHLENSSPRDRSVAIAPEGLLITDAGRAAVPCALWQDAASLLRAARRTGLPFAPLCDGALSLRNPVVGSQTQLERTSAFLRDRVWGGEKLLGFVKREFFQDAFVESGVPASGAAGDPHGDMRWPRPARVAAERSMHALVPERLGIQRAGRGAAMRLGQWYPAAGVPDVFVSLMQAGAVAPALLQDHRNRVRELDGVESAALVYLVAFDLAAFELGFALGTDHPRVGWSDQVSAGRRSALPGPDGIDTIAPLVSVGMVPPGLVGRTVATFTGGFKRQHGAFRHGPLAERNRGSHYGFVEQGTVLSRLVPGLATVYTLVDGGVGIRTWHEADDVALLPRLRHARQNGVPLTETGSDGEVVPGAFVAQWGAGNWSGSPDAELRALRAGACLLEAEGRRHLVYAYFSSATPSAMARVFQAYGCAYAIHLDMNALEHTYLAIYTRTNGELAVAHMVKGMEVLDRTIGGKLAPRFLAVPDNRDFFYLTRRATLP